ncbi:unnamed protein product [Ilex paraguariensis]|uniref:BRCT domain-containing protein n=1 Tax=Ilex paraguariensis TaxID=185542 RepID=A0ABC8RKL3_9AQUA
MGSPGDDDDKMEPIERNSAVDISDDETQPFDSQFSPTWLSDGDKGEDELQCLQSTVPFDDHVPLEDVFETQVLNLGGETPVLNFGGETQVMDDPNCEENICTQLVDVCDTEVVIGSNGEGTEILGDTEELSDGDSLKRGGNHPLDQENMQALCKRVDDQSKEESDDLSNEKCSSGSFHRDFTSVRAASIRTSGTAARSMATRRTNRESCSITSDSQSLKQHNKISISDSPACGKEVHLLHALEEYGARMKGFSNENRCNVSSSTVRKLFAEDTLAATKGPHQDGSMNDTDGVANLPQSCPLENGLAGLSYVNSQEPGELSQANALDFVDKFLKVNVTDFDEELDFGKSTGRKARPASSAKGTQSLAKRANFTSTDGERGIYEWDDSREDEGGGEFFRKKKDALFDNGGQRRRSLSHPRKRRFLDSKGSHVVEESGNKIEQLDIHEKIMDSLYSDSRLVLHNVKGNGKSRKVMERESKKTLIKELGEHLNVGSADGMVDTGTAKDVPDKSSMGFDTQMAAEAMEALCVGLVVTDHDGYDANQGAENMQKGSCKGETIDRTNSKQNTVQKRECSYSRVSTRQSKQTKRSATKLGKETSISLLKKPKNFRKQCDAKLEKSDMKRVKSDVKKRFATKRSNSLSKVVIEQESALGRIEVDEIDRCDVNASRGQMSVKKRPLQEQFDTFTSIARRTRQCMEGNQSKKAGNVSNNVREEVSNPTVAGTLKDKRKRSRVGMDASIMLSVEDKSSEVKLVTFSEHEQSDPKLKCTTSAVNLDELDYPRGRRTRQRLSAVGKNAKKQSKTTLRMSEIDAVSASVDLGIKRKTRSSVCTAPVLPSLDRHTGERLLEQSVDKGRSGDATVNCNFGYINENATPKDVVEPPTSKHSNGRSNADTPYVKGAEANALLKASPKERCELSASACTTPVNCRTPINAGSPICMGGEYLKQSCRKNLSRSSLSKEINTTGMELTSALNYSRRRRDVTNVRVLFSQHLDGDTTRQQKKILSRLRASVASSISDATHFVTDKFVRTRNMLEAIASGKPVVTHLWLESCGQASCFVDERNYILRDAKKETECGFSMPVSLARACEHPLLQVITRFCLSNQMQCMSDSFTKNIILQGQRVLITPNTKPGKEILASLVKAVQGVVCSSP